MKIPFKVFLDTQNLLSGYDTPELHLEIADWLQRTRFEHRRIFQCFRNAGKSYILCCYIAWRLLTDPNYTCIIISAKRQLALRNSMMIRSIIETNPLTKHLKSEFEQWQAQQFSVDRDVIQLNPSVTVTSLQSSFTGSHAQEIIADDIEVSQNVTTEDSREFIKDRLQEFGKVAKHILLTGTPHHTDSVYTHAQSIGYKCFLKKPIYDDKGQLAWPNHPEGMFTWDWIERAKQETTTGDFQSQYLLVPSKTYEALMDVDKIEFYDDNFTVQHIAQPMGNYLPIVRLGNNIINRMCAAYDPATGLRGRDMSVVAFTARDDKGNVYVHDVIELSEARNKDFTIQCNEIITACDNYKVGHVFVEENFSPTLANELRRTAVERKKKIVVVPEFRTSNKLNFIAQMLEPVIKVGKLRVHNRVKENSHFLSQLEEFPYNRFDDCIDAVSMAISKLPEPTVDVGKIPMIRSPITSAGIQTKINDGFR